MYYAIIGDMKNSKTIINREEIQDKLKSVLKKINNTYSKDIAANFLITLGDEFQGLLQDASHLLDILKHIQREMYPVELRFGVGIGDMKTKINREAAIGADGPAFYAARDMIIEMHNQERKLKKQAPNILLNYYEQASFEVTQINTMLLLLKTIEDSWNEKERYTIWDMICYQDSQEQCAKRQNTTQSTIARRLAEGKYMVYTNALKTIDEAINEVE